MKRPRGGPVAIRPITRADADRIEDFFETLSADTRRFFHPHPFDQDAAVRVAGATDGIRILAHYGGRMVGYAFADGDPPVVGLAVGDPWQGRGIGRRLLEEIHHRLRAAGHAKARLTVYKANDHALALYQAVGYRVTGETTRGPSAGEEWWMEIDLADTTRGRRRTR